MSVQLTLLLANPQIVLSFKNCFTCPTKQRKLLTVSLAGNYRNDLAQVIRCKIIAKVATFWSTANRRSSENSVRGLQSFIRSLKRKCIATTVVFN